MKQAPIVVFTVLLVSGGAIRSGWSGRLEIMHGK